MGLRPECQSEYVGKGLEGEKWSLRRYVDCAVQNIARKQVKNVAILKPISYQDRVKLVFHPPY